MRKLIKSKKGQIPTTDIIGSIVNGIRSFISWFLQVTPKPLLFLFFLVFILLLGNFLMPLIVNGMGYHCDTNYNVWKVTGLEIFTNFDLLRNKPNYDEPDIVEVPFICFSSTGARTISYCTNCTYDPDSNGGCLTDGYRLEEYSGIGKTFYCEWLGCSPEQGYFFDTSANVFICYEDYCINKTLEDYNNRLYSIEGAIPVYQDQLNNNSVYNMIQFKCQENNPLNIRLTFFGIDVFDYRVWVALALIFALIWVMVNVKK